MYAFGELVEDVHAMRNQNGTITEEKPIRKTTDNARREAAEKVRREAEVRAQRQQDNEFQECELSDDDFIDIACPKCGEMLSFLKNEDKGICLECGTEFEIK